MNRRQYYEQDEFTLKEKIQYSLLGLVVVGSAFYFGKKLVKQTQSNNEERYSWDDGSAAAFAKQIKMAFENDMPFSWGTDEGKLRDALRKIPSKDVFKDVMKSYEKLYSSSLMRDLKDELTSTEYSEMLSIIAGKADRIIAGQTPQYSSVQYQSWARRLKAAFDITYGFFPGTDEPAIKAVFMEIPTRASFQLVARAYKQEFGNDLISDLKSELEFWEYAPMMNIINKKPKA
jgi:hypothetical protein